MRLPGSSIISFRMSVVCNITFVCQPKDAEQVVEYITTVVAPAIVRGGVIRPRLSRVQSDDEESVSFPFEVTLPVPEQMQGWFGDVLAPALQTLAADWGERLLFFVTAMEVLPLPAGLDAAEICTIVN